MIYAYRKPALSPAQKETLLSGLRRHTCPDIEDLDSEFCFSIDTNEDLLPHEMEILRWLLSETFEPNYFSSESLLGESTEEHPIYEVGPRMSFTTAWSTNAVAVCRACGITKISRIERSRRYRLFMGRGFSPSLWKKEGEGKFLGAVHDRMTECLYRHRVATFLSGKTPEPVKTVRIIEEGRSALEKINRELGLGLDARDIEYYSNLFVTELGRNPTDVECFDLAQSNSEHSRHWFFRGKLIINGEEVPRTLMEAVKEPFRLNPNNSIIAFGDNSSAIRGYPISTFLPEKPGRPSRFVSRDRTYHITFTAETHNFPSGVAPFPGAETGTGGRIRDVQAVGRGGLVIAGTAAYCVGNLRIPGYPQPWEDESLRYPTNLAPPLQIEIEASNGASDYGNKFGEPLIQGYTRSFGLMLPGGERREWLKPIMFTGGVGQMDAGQVSKDEPQKGMLVIKVGGPAYRIGIGGGAASSMIQGENIEELDFNAVQRGDAEMEQKLNRVIRTCVELGSANPIVSIHDQGAGGNCNVIKELIYPAGAGIEVREIPLGDNTLSVLEIWGAEYQESNALLLKPEHLAFFRGICDREKVPCAVIGRITGDGAVILHDRNDGTTPVNLDLKKVLGEMPQKIFRLERLPVKTEPLNLPAGLTVKEALQRVLRLVSVGSKRFLTNKVDRSVTGLIARQQCAGPLQLTVSDVAVIGQSHFGLTGAAIAVGEQPLKGLLDPAAMARMSVAEAITNIVWAKVSSMEDIRCSANWMWAAKLPGEGAALYDAALAMRGIMTALGIAVDGGKDSLSMAAMVTHDTGQQEVVKAPGTLVISAYVTCPDITKVVTPDIKHPGRSNMLFIDLAPGKCRTGGSALAQVFSQVGDTSPDIENPELIKKAFNAVQQCIDEDCILSGHDRSDGGLITALLEMAFSGNCGLDILLNGNSMDPMPLLFAEEAGLLIEYLPENEKKIFSILDGKRVGYSIIGKTLQEKKIRIAVDAAMVLEEGMEELRALWEETSYQIERLQANPACADEERKNTFRRKAPCFSVSFTPEQTPFHVLSKSTKPAVAVIREEGSNGDREMASAFTMAGFEPWDVTMGDLASGEITLDRFRGVAFVGGFSYADVLDSAKGWAGVIRFHEKLSEQFARFSAREDSFSLGVCNGCQLMALLGWVPWQGIADPFQPRFIHNRSGRFESRFSTVKILHSSSIMLRGMEGSVLGIWVAHGEGMAYFPDKNNLEKVLASGIAPIRYVTDAGEITGDYPFNPNGSPEGIAALCSPDGRHLAMMPHPERAFLLWQWAWLPEEWKKNLSASPWLKMFQNAREWCNGNG